MSVPPAAPKSVNWTTGMLLTPDHFRTQDAYVDASVAWVLRYCVSASGLVGGGARVGEAERGLARFDPRLQVSDDGETVRVAVLEARGITPSGEPVDVGGSDPARGEFRKSDLAGATELLVHLVREEGKEEDDGSVGGDPANPTQAALLKPRFRVALGAGADVAARAVVVGRLRRASETLAFEPDGRFIPPCATVMAHSEMYAGWCATQTEVVRLAGQFAELHRAVSRYAPQVGKHGFDTLDDREVLAFVERAVLALDECAYETLDPAIAPEHLFRQVERAARRVAVALDLSGAAQAFFETLSGADASYTALVEDERRALGRERAWTMRDELRHALERAAQTLGRLRRLCEALEGKYVDYRLSRSIGSLKFLLDRGGEQFYIAVATPVHPQSVGDLLTFSFTHMSLTGRHQYRVVLLGDPEGTPRWRPGVDELRVDLRLNAASGSARPLSETVRCEVLGQRNFAVDFETPANLDTLSELQVTVQPGHGIRGAVLYQRRLGLVSESLAAPAPVAPLHDSRFDAAPPYAPAPAPPAADPRPRIRIKKP